MGTFWKNFALPVIMTILFSYFIIPITLITIILSRFLRRELKKLIMRYGRENVVKITLQGNIKGLLDLFIRSRRERA